MSWTETVRRDHARRGLRYSSDLTDREWALISPFLPEPRPLGRPRTTDLRKVMNAICIWQQVAERGCCCPGTSRLSRPSSATFTTGATVGS